MPAKSHKISNEYTSINSVKLIRAGKVYFNTLIELIRQATDSIHIQVYTYNDDETGREVADALINAAKRKVSVHLMADGYASRVMPNSLINELRNAGIHFRFFEPVFRSRYFYFGRRMHHKVVVIDAKYALVGGINIANRYNDMPGKTAWLDFALFAEGEIAKELCILCWKTWNGFVRNLETTPCEEKKINFEIARNNAVK